MKREILFKAKRSDNGEWVEGLLYFSHGTGTYKITCSNGWIPSYSNPDEGETTLFIDIKPDTVCQFIDEYKGKLFWESDRVMHPELGEGVIKYANTGFVVVYADNYTIDLHEDWDELEIIGNIHD
jgi:hypothetical protein